MEFDSLPSPDANAEALVPFCDPAFGMCRDIF
jgi:hypothetical protein